MSIAEGSTRRQVQCARWHLLYLLYLLYLLHLLREPTRLTYVLPLWLPPVDEISMPKPISEVAARRASPSHLVASLAGILESYLNHKVHKTNQVP